jgi:hypothetical protein
MGRLPLVPLELTKKPFTIEEARRAGLSRWHLEGSSWRRLGPEVYAWVGLPDTPPIRLAAAQLRLPRSAVFSGLTAAWLHGLDVEPCNPIEVTLPINAGISLRSGLAIRRATLVNCDVTIVKQLKATTIERTLADLCLNLSLVEAVVAVDAATHQRLTSIKHLLAQADRIARRAGVTSFRRVIDLTEPATESPMESRLRMTLVLAGLPRPAVQMPLHDRSGGFLGRPDLYYADSRLGIEYDGGVHRTSLVDDNRRQNRLLAEGIRLLRFTAGDIYTRPQALIDQVRVTLRRRAA